MTDFLTSLGQPWSAGFVLATLLDLTIKSTLILALAGIATSLLRNRSAAVRHSVWLAAVLAILVLPILTSALPSWRVMPASPALMAGIPVPAPIAAPPAHTALPPEPPAPLAAPRFPEPILEAAPAPVLPAPPAAFSADESIQPPSAPAKFGNDDSVSSEAAPLGARATILGAFRGIATSIAEAHWTVLFFGVWVLGLMALMGNHLLGAIGLYMVSRRSRPVTTDEWRDLIDEIGDRLWVTREVRLYRSHVATMPITWGGRRPVILLPSDADSWSDDRRRYVLTHEMAHIKRWDCTTQGFAQIACALYWFNPLVWIAAKRLRVERERACDDQVLMTGGRASTYAEHLLDIARSLKATFVSPLGAVAMARPSQLEGRVLAILDPARRRHSFNRLQTGGVVVAALLFVVPIAAMAPPESAGERSPSVPEVVAAVAAKPAAVAGVPTLPASSPAVVPGSPAVVSGRPAVVSASPAGVSGSPDVVPALRVLIPADPKVDSARPEIGSVAFVDSPKLAFNPGAPVGFSRQIAVPDTIEGRKRQLVDAFLIAIEDEEPEIRVHAAHMLGDLGDDRALNALRTAVEGDASLEVRRAALWALAEMGDEGSMPIVMEAMLREPDADVRRNMAMIVSDNAEEGDEEAGRALMRLLEDPSAEVREAAIWGLGEMEYRAALPALLALADDSEGDVSRRAIWAIAELAEDHPDDESIAILARALDSMNPEARAMAAWALGELEAGQATDALTRVIQDEDDDVRRNAVWALGEIGNPDAVGALAEALRDDAVEVRRAAAYALSEIDSDEGRRVLATASSDADINVRRQAIYALAESAGSEAANALIQAAGDEDEQIRRAAVSAMADLEDSRFLDALIEAARDEASQVRRYAIYGLGEMDSSRRVVEALSTALGDSSEEVRRAAISALGDMDDPAAIPSLIRATRDDSPEVRRSAAWAISEFASDSGSPEAVAALVRLLSSDEHAEVRKAAAHGLGEVGDQSALEALTEALGDPDKEVRRAATYALGNIDMDPEDHEPGDGSGSWHDAGSDADSDADSNHDSDAHSDSRARSDRDSRSNSASTGEWDISVNVAGGTGAALGHALSGLVVGVTSAALTTAGSALMLVDTSEFQEEVESALADAQLDVEAFTDELMSSLNAMEREISTELTAEFIEALACLIEEDPGSVEARAALRSLRQMDSRRARKELRRLGH